MKLIFLIAIIFIFSFANGAIIERRINTRTISVEERSLEIEVLSTCQEFKNNVLPTVWISAHRRCLPVQNNVTENPDYNDLSAHYFCTTADERRSIVHFVEIFSEPDETTLVPNFVVSFVPTSPFRVLTQKTSLARRPNCFVTNDYCDGNNAIINNCKTNEIRFKERKHGRRERHYVVSHDRIYITSNQQVSNDCKTSATECCNYISPSIFGGICDHEAPTDRLELPKERKEGKGKGGKKGGEGKPQGKGNAPQGKSGKDVAVEVAPVVKEIIAPAPEIAPQEVRAPIIRKKKVKSQKVQKIEPVKVQEESEESNEEEEEDNEEN